MNQLDFSEQINRICDKTFEYMVVLRGNALNVKCIYYYYCIFVYYIKTFIIIVMLIVVILYLYCNRL